jgi:hypothetical protein
VSLVCWALLGAILLFLGCSLVATLVGSITWLLLLNFCSYVKLGITLVKYMPQAFMNYRYSILYRRKERKFLSEVCYLLFYFLVLIAKCLLSRKQF